MKASNRRSRDTNREQKKNKSGWTKKQIYRKKGRGKLMGVRKEKHYVKEKSKQ